VTDEQFFAMFPDRQARIRVPGKQPFKDQQRAVRYLDECELEFRSLGGHDVRRRRLIIWRVPKDNVYFDPEKSQLLKIPFLTFSDETIEDTDACLLPILHEIMKQAAS
jgi:hypothetical protein